MKMFLFDRNQKVKRWLVDRDFIEAKMVEQINAADQLTFSVPLTKRLPSSYFYAAIPQPRGSGYLLFKIVTEKVSSDQIEYTAIESAYDELKSYHYIKDVRPENRKAGELLQTALEGTRWQVGQTYDSGTFSTNFYYISTLEAIQKIVELCGLEVTFEITLNPKTHQIEHRLVNLYAQQGQRTGKRFEYGSNLLTVEREESAENLITALIGRGKGEAVYHEDNTAEETPDGYGRRINFADVVWSKKNGNPADKPAGQEYVEDVDATAKYGFDDGKPRIGIEIFEDITDPAELLKATWSALQTLKRPQASFRAGVIDVGDLGLGDTVAIVRHDIKIEYFTRVYKVTHNLLDERQNTIELGDDFSGSSITSTVNDLGKSVGTVERIANYAAVSANGKNANYYGQAQPINPMEGDLWYKDLGNGETDMYQYHAGNWILITSTRDLRNVEKQVKQAQDDFNTAWNKAIAADSSAAKAQQRADDVGKQLQSAQSDFDSKLSAASASASAANDKAMQAANAAQNDVDEQIKELNAYKDTVGKTYVAKGTVISNVNLEADASIFSTSNKLYMDAATTVFSGKAFIPDAAIINLTASKLTAGTIDASKISVVNLNASNINTGTLNAGLIKAGSMSADRIVGGTIDFSKVNAASLSADKITSGTLDAGNVNVINLNADNITSGTINGQNLKINLNTGEILFQKGKIASTNGLLNINVDDGTMSVTNSLNEGAFFKNGNIELTNFALWDKGDIPAYGKIAFAENMFELGNNGIEIQGKKGWIIHSENFDYNKFPLQYLWTMEKNGTSIGGNDQYIAMQAYSGISITAGAFLPHLESSLSESFKTAPYLNLGFNRDATYHNPAFVANSNAYEFSVDNTGTFMKYGRVYLNDSDYTYQFYVDLPWNSHIKLADDMGHDGRNAYFDVSVGGQTVIAFDNNGAYSLPKARTYIPNLTANSLTVTGSKNAIVPTSAGATLINAYETAEYYFGDIGEGTTDKKCVAQVTIDPLFLETVNTSVPYQVFVSSYDNATVWVESRTANIFVVRSSKPNVSFCWELKAKRKGYEHSRLEVDDSISAEDLRKAAKK